MALNSIDQILLNQKVVVCAGSGGVGKTTVASAIAVRASQLERRTLVLTVDPARRLATALGLDLNGAQPKEVALATGKAKLEASVIDSKKIFDEFILAHAKGSEVVARIMKNRLYQQMSTTLSGSQEFTSLERLLQAVESDRYDLVVLDTPPTKHAVDFLTAPHRINALFQDAITRWFMNPNERSAGFIASLVGRGTRTVLKSLETLTGGPFIEELVDFFSSIRSIQGVLRARSVAIERMLTGPEARFIVVASFDAAKLIEANYLQRQLTSLGYTMQALVINRAFPTWLPEEVHSVSGTDPVVYEKVLNFYQKFKEYYSIRYNLYERFARELDPSVALVRIPEYGRDIYGLEDLEVLATALGGTSPAKGCR